MGARFYVPTLGRWLSEDPVQDKHFEPASLNFYVYVFNNPVLLTDPRGTDPFEDPPAYPSGPTPEGIKKTEERLQAFLDALNALNELVETMISRGITSITFAGRQFSLANVQQAANFLASRAVDVVNSRTENLIRMGYEFSGYVGSIGFVLALVGVVMMGQRNPFGATLLSAGLILMGVGWGAWGLAWLADTILTGGRVRRNPGPAR